MAQFSKTWWGKRFIEALEEISDSARLGRGRSYARNGKIKEYHITNNQITAFVRGSVNPYFGVYKEPLYNTNIEIKAIAPKDWSKIISYLGSKASLISKLLMNEVPDNIEEVFAQLNLPLLPHSRQDFKTNCSCPDWENPCKHIAGGFHLYLSFVSLGRGKEKVIPKIDKITKTIKLIHQSNKYGETQRKLRNWENF